MKTNRLLSVLAGQAALQEGLYNYQEGKKLYWPTFSAYIYEKQNNQTNSSYF